MHCIPNLNQLYDYFYTLFSLSPSLPLLFWIKLMNACGIIAVNRIFFMMQSSMQKSTIVSHIYWHLFQWQKLVTGFPLYKVHEFLPFFDSWFSRIIPRLHSISSFLLHRFAFASDFQLPITIIWSKSHSVHFRKKIKNRMKNAVFKKNKILFEPK